MGQEPLLLDHRLPELGVSHHHDVEDALALVLEVVLLEHPERGALRYRDLALAGLLPSAQDLEQGGFARAVRAHDAVALPGVELEGDTFEEGLIGEVLGQIRD
jgi:hypothetical protein